MKHSEYKITNDIGKLELLHEKLHWVDGLYATKVTSRSSTHRKILSTYNGNQKQNKGKPPELIEYKN